MKTLILENTGRLTRYSPVHPFFYSHCSRGDLVFTGSSRSNHGREKSFDSDIIYRKLTTRGWQRNQWQLVVLLPLTTTGKGHVDLPSHGSRVDMLARLVRECIHPLEQQQMQPVRAVVVFCDSIPRHEVTGKPFSGREQQRFQIDTMGYLPDPGEHDPLFNLSDLDELGSVWPEAIDLHDCSVDRGMDGLPEDKRREIDKRCDEAKKVLHAIVKRKIAAIGQYTNENYSLFLDISSLEQVEDRFGTELERYRNSRNLSMFESYSPRSHLEKILREIFSAHGVVNGRNIATVRFPINDDHHDLPATILRLCYFVLALCEQGTDLDLSECRNLQARVSIDREFLAVALGQARACWLAAGLQLQQKKECRSESRLSWRDPCPGHDSVAANTCTIRPPERVRTWNFWRDIMAANTRSFNEFRNNSEYLLAGFRKSILSHRKSREKIVDSIGEELRKLKEQQKVQTEKLLDNPYQDFTRIISNWQDKKNNLSVRAHLFFQEQPSVSTRFLLVMITLLILGMPPLVIFLEKNNLQGNGLSLFKEPVAFITPAVLLTLSLLPILILQLRDKYRLAKLVSRLDKAIRDTSRHLQEIFTHNLEYLYQLCCLAVTRHNETILRKERTNQRHRLQLVDFFLEQIEIHAVAMEQLGADTTITCPETVIREPDFTLPPEGQVFFRPVHWLQRRTSCSYKVDNEGALKSASSPDMPGIEQITIRREV